MNENETIRDLLSAYLDDELDGRQQERVEAALRADAALRQELEALRATRDLVRALPRERLGEGFPARVLERVERRQLVDDEAAHEAPGRWAARLVAAALLLVAAGIGAVVVDGILSLPVRWDEPDRLARGKEETPAPEAHAAPGGDGAAPEYRLALDGGAGTAAPTTHGRATGPRVSAGIRALPEADGEAPDVLAFGGVAFDGPVLNVVIDTPDVEATNFAVQNEALIANGITVQGEARSVPEAVRQNTLTRYAANASVVRQNGDVVVLARGTPEQISRAREELDTIRRRQVVSQVPAASARKSALAPGPRVAGRGEGLERRARRAGGAEVAADAVAELRRERAEAGLALEGEARPEAVKDDKAPDGAATTPGSRAPDEDTGAADRGKGLDEIEAAAKPKDVPSPQPPAEAEAANEDARVAERMEEGAPDAERQPEHKSRDEAAGRAGPALADDAGKVGQAAGGTDGARGTGRAAAAEGPSPEPVPEEQPPGQGQPVAGPAAPKSAVEGGLGEPTERGRTRGRADGAAAGAEPAADEPASPAAKSLLEASNWQWLVIYLRFRGDGRSAAEAGASEAPADSKRLDAEAREAAPGEAAPQDAPDAPGDESPPEPGPEAPADTSTEAAGASRVMMPAATSRLIPRAKN